MLLATLLLFVCPLAAETSDTFELSWADPRVEFAGEIVFTDALKPPADDADWRPVTLPDLWHERPPMSSDRAWYRFSIDRSIPPDEQWAIYLWRYSMNARIYFNQDLLVDGGSFEIPVARNIHRPLLAHIPSSAWRDENYVYVHLRGFPNYGYLLPIGVGPLSAFAEPYAERFFLQIELSRYLFIVTVLIAVFALVFWLVDRSSSAYGYFAAACLSWSVYSLNPFIQTVPFSNIVWLRILHTSIDLFGALLLLFIHRQLNHKAPRLERAVLLFVVVAAAFYSTLPIQTITRMASLTHLVTNLLAVYMIVFCIRNYLRERNPEALLYMSMLLVLLGVSLHDLLLTSGAAEDLWITNFLAFSLGAPIVFIVLIVYMAWRMGRENLYWAARVQAVTGRLATEYDEREKLERDRAAADERERIYRDLHDDIGARLLSMVYKAESPEQAERARAALKEVRAIAARSKVAESDLADAAVDWHQEMRTRLEEAGLELNWEESNLHPAIGAEPAYQLTRVLRELVSNVLKHASATQVSCTIAVVDDSIEIQFQDDGVGIDQDQQTQGTGMAGITRRMAELGGKVSWQPTAPGTMVTLTYPLNRGSLT